MSSETTGGDILELPDAPGEAGCPGEGSAESCLLNARAHARWGFAYIHALGDSGPDTPL